MAIKILKGGLKALEPEKELLTSLKKPESISESIVRNVSRIPLSVLKPVAGVQDIYEGITGDKEGGWFNSEQLERGYEKLTNAPKGYYKPQGTFEELGDMIVSDAPFIAASALTGGLSALAPSLARSVGANVGIKGAQEAGFGTVGQIVGSILGAKSPAKIQSIVKGFNKNPKIATKNLLTHMQKAATKSYDSSTKELHNIKGPVKELPKNLQNIVEDVGFIPNRKNISAARDIENVLEEMYGGKLDINKAKKYSQKFKSEGFNKNHSPEIKNAYKKAGMTLRDWIYDLEPEIGKGISDYKRANELHTLNKAQNKFEKIINESASAKNLFSSSFLSSLISGGVKKAGLIPVSRAKKFWREPEAREYMKEIFDAIDFGADKEALIAVHKLGKSAKEYQDKIKGLQEADKPKFKVIKGGLK